MPPRPRIAPTSILLERFKNKQAKYTTSLQSREKDGLIVDWTVVIRDTNRANRTFKQHRFDDLITAKAFYEQVKREGVPDYVVNLTVKEYENSARAIVLSRLSYLGIPNLVLLLAIDRVRRGSTNPKYNCVADGIVTILRNQLTIPTETKSFQQWIAHCTHLLMTKHTQGTQSVSEDTARHRLRFFKRALKCISDYSDQINGSSVYLPYLSKIDVTLQDARKLLKGQLRSRDTYKPLTLSQINKSIDSVSSINSKMYLLKVLSIGFRPGEALRATYSKVVQGKLLLNQIITKTEHVKDKIQSPEAPISLRLIMRFEEQVNLILTKTDKSELAALSPPVRAMRTTSACHTLYSGANIEVVRQRLGHTSLDMVVRHYNLYSIEDIGSLDPIEYYNIPETIKINNEKVDLSFGLLWDRWILLKTLQVIQKELPDHKNIASEILLEEIGTKKIKKQEVFEF